MLITDYLEDIYNDTELTTEKKESLIVDKLNAKLADGDIDLKNYAGRCGWTHLMVAVQRNDFVTAQWLLDHELDINQGNYFGCTPLHVAAENPNDCPDMVDFLIAKGAILHAKISHCAQESMTGDIYEGETPIIFAVLRGNFNIFRTLFDNYFYKVGRIDELLSDALTTATTILTLLKAEDQTITNICIPYKHLNRINKSAVDSSWWNSSNHNVVAKRRDTTLISYIGMTSIDPEHLRQMIKHFNISSNNVRTGVCQHSCRLGF
jgi:hypothetical protein